MEDRKMKGQKDLGEEVLGTGLCTGCGACVKLCPYMVSFHDRIVVMDSCDRSEGRCYAFCPRTPTDFEALRRRFYAPGDMTPELGAVKGFFMTRAADPALRRRGQHGATATLLISLALAEGIIQAAVLAEEEEKFLPRPVVITDSKEVLHSAGSKFVVSPTVAGFHEAAQENFPRIGVVATPCQAQALAKMRGKPFPSNDSQIEKLQLVVGLFCGWALSWIHLRKVLQAHGEADSIMGLDIPPSRFKCMEVSTRAGRREIPIEEVLPGVRESCLYCQDMTAEFSDISVGSGRHPGGWELARDWNQVIVRTRPGMELIELARRKGLLEFQEMPTGNLEKLKTASVAKKNRGAKNLAEKRGKTPNKDRP